MAKAHMTPFQEAAFIPFEIVFLHEALERGSGPLVYTAVVLAGLLYARYVGGIFAECYDSFSPERRNARSRVPLVAALIADDYAHQLSKPFVHELRYFTERSEKELLSKTT